MRIHPPLFCPVMMVLRAFVAAFIVALPVSAQSPPAVEAQPTITQADVRTELRTLSDSKNVSPELEQKAMAIYNQALAELALAENWQTKAAAFRAERAGAPKQLDEAKAQLNLPPAESDAQADAKLSLDDLKQRLVDAESAHAAAGREQAELDARSRYRSDRVDEVRTLDADAKARLDEIDSQLEAMPEGPDPADPTRRAARVLLLAKRAKIVAERSSYEEELPCYEATHELLRVRLDLATRRLNQAEKLERQWKDLVAERSRVDAANDARNARWAVLTARPELIPLARQNERLAELRSSADGPAAKLQQIERDVGALTAERARVQAQFSHVRKLAELTDAVGQLLQRQRDELPDLRQHRGNIRARQAEIADLKLRLIDFEGQRAELADIETQAQQVVAAFDPPPASDAVTNLEAAVRDLLETRRGYLDALIADYGRYFNALVMEVDRSERDLIHETEAYANFINERIFWIRSSPVLGVDDLPRVGRAALWLVDPARWREVTTALWTDVRKYPLLYVVAVLLLGALVAGQRRLRKRVRSIGAEMAASYATSCAATLRVLLITVLIALMVPAMMAFVAWRLSAGWDEPDFCKTVAFGLQITALAIFASELLRQICRRHGLGEVHFGWPRERLAVLRKHLRWLIVVGAPLTFVVAAIHQQESEFHNASLGRLTFIVGLGCLAIFTHCVLPARRPTHPTAAHPGVAPEAAAWSDTVYTLARWTALGSLLALGGLAVLGYYYTALQLTCRVQVTIWLVLGLIVAKFLLLRWLLVARSKLAIQQAQRRRAAAMATPQGAAQDGGRSATSTGDMLLDLTAIDLQSRRLVRGSITLALIVGLWGIWVGVLPALKYLDQWQLWTYTETVTVPTAPGETPQGPSTVLRSITLRDLLLSVAIVVMTVVASRNLPGLIEIAWLRRLPLDPGGRYAITSISRYIIVVVGVVGAFRSVGIGWSNVQWLAAAITVGLGFGLQEIFANLISGLIILFERPMRVGDTVTVAGVSGTVTRIRSRATTITDWDRKELIVPNKEFITGQLVNWTLSDSVLRAVVHVGTSYGSDPTEVVQLLYEMAHNHPMVLADPRPTAVLAGFGDSSLNFELRVFVAGTDKLVPVQHDLHVQIEERFRQAGIEIPFPQCDVRVRDLPKGLVVQPAHAGSEVRPLHFATRAFVAEPGK